MEVAKQEFLWIDYIHIEWFIFLLYVHLNGNQSLCYSYCTPLSTWIATGFGKYVRVVVWVFCLLNFSEVRMQENVYLVLVTAFPFCPEASHSFAFFSMNLPHQSWRIFHLLKLLICFLTSFLFIWTQFCVLLHLKNWGQCIGCLLKPPPFSSF